MDKIDELLKWIDESRHIVFFGGAGVSTESGIPDFRSKDGLYNQHDVRFDDYSPEYLLSHSCLYHHSDVFYEFYKQKMDVRGIKPNITHNTLAYMESIGKLDAVVTQNIDGLHQKAGSQKVYEIHGTTKVNYCDQCKKVYPSNYIFDSVEKVPHCDCGGLIRPDVTLYEEALPSKTVSRAIAAIENSDLLIVAGTSLTVYPASNYIYYFKGKHMVVINRDQLSVKLGKEDLFIQENMSNVFKKIYEHLSR